MIKPPTMELPCAMGCHYRDNRDDFVWCMVKRRGHLLYSGVAIKKWTLVEFLYRCFESHDSAWTL